MFAHRRWLNQLGCHGRRCKLFSQPSPKVKHRRQAGKNGGFCRQRAQMGWDGMGGKSIVKDISAISCC